MVRTGGHVLITGALVLACVGWSGRTEAAMGVATSGQIEDNACIAYAGSNYFIIYQMNGTIYRRGYTLAGAPDSAYPAKAIHTASSGYSIARLDCASGQTTTGSTRVALVWEETNASTTNVYAKVYSLSWGSPSRITIGKFAGGFYAARAPSVTFTYAHHTFYVAYQLVGAWVACQPLRADAPAAEDSFIVNSFTAVGGGFDETDIAGHPTDSSTLIVLWHHTSGSWAHPRVRAVEMSGPTTVATFHPEWAIPAAAVQGRVTGTSTTGLYAVAYTSFGHVYVTKVHKTGGVGSTSSQLGYQDQPEIGRKRGSASILLVTRDSTTNNIKAYDWDVSSNSPNSTSTLTSTQPDLHPRVPQAGYALFSAWVTNWGGSGLDYDVYAECPGC